jgi:hypothetical protein
MTQTRWGRIKLTILLILMYCICGGIPVHSQNHCANFGSGFGEAGFSEKKCPGQTVTSCCVNNHSTCGDGSLVQGACCYNGQDYTAPRCVGSTIQWNCSGPYGCTECPKATEVSCVGCQPGDACTPVADSRGCYSATCVPQGCSGTCSPTCTGNRVCESTPGSGGACTYSCVCPDQPPPPSGNPCPAGFRLLNEYSASDCAWLQRCIPTIPVTCPTTGQSDPCEVFQLGCSGPGLGNLQSIGYCCMASPGPVFPRLCGNCETVITTLYPCNLPAPPTIPTPIPTPTPTPALCDAICPAAPPGETPTPMPTATCTPQGTVGAQIGSITSGSTCGTLTTGPSTSCQAIVDLGNCILNDLTTCANSCSAFHYETGPTFPGSCGGCSSTPIGPYTVWCDETATTAPGCAGCCNFTGTNCAMTCGQGAVLTYVGGSCACLPAPPTGCPSCPSGYESTLIGADCRCVSPPTLCGNSCPSGYYCWNGTCTNDACAVSKIDNPKCKPSCTGACYSNCPCVEQDSLSGDIDCSIFTILPVCQNR